VHDVGLHAPEDIVFSPDGRFLYMADAHANVIPYDVSTGAPLRRFERDAAFFKKHSFPRAIAASQDGRLLAAGGRNMIPGPKEKPYSGQELFWARILDAATGKEVALLEHEVTHIERKLGQVNPSSESVAIAFSPDGRMFALGAERAAWIYETAGWKELRRVDMNDTAAGLAFSPDGRLLAISGSLDYSVRLVNAATGEVEKVLANPRTKDFGVRFVGNHSKVVFSPDGRRIVATGPRGSLRIWDAASGETVGFMGASTDGTTRLAASRDGKKIAVAGRADNLVRVWNLETGSQGAMAGPHAARILGLALTPDGRYGISWGGAEIRVWDAATGLETRRMDHRNDNTGQPWDDAKCGKIYHPRTYMAEIHQGSVSADGRYVATSGLDCTLRVWEVESGKEVRRIEGFFRYVALSRDGRWVAARFGETGDPVRVWEVASGREVGQVRDVTAFIMFFDEDNRLVMTGPSLPGLMPGKAPFVVWDVEGRREIRRDPGIGTALHPWNFSGEYLAAIDFGVVQLLDSRAGKRADPARPLPQRGFLRDAAVVPGKCCMVVSGDSGELALYDHRTGELRATLVSVRDDGDWPLEMQRTGRAWSGDDWLVVTPDGLFDGPPSAFNKLLWRFSDRLGDVAPGEAFFNEFYRPGLLADIMVDGRKPTAPRNIADIDRRQPRVQLTVPPGPVAQGTVTVKVRVSEAPSDGTRAGGSGARDVRLFRNGSLVRVWRGDVATGKGPRELEATVTIVAGENRFTAYAFNRDNVKSADAVATVEGAAALKRGGTAWVLAVGVNRYANPGFDLRYAVADAEAFTAELTRAQGAVGGYERVQTAILRDGEATKANVLAALRRLAGRESGAGANLPAALAQFGPARPEDAVFIFFAGHGMADEPRFYLVPHDIGYAGDPAKMDDKGLKAMLAASISDLELEQVLEGVDAGRLVMVIDACHSGQALEAEEKRRGPMNSRGLAQLAYEKGMYVLTAAQGHQAALEFAAVGHGLLTHALVEEGLKAGAADRSPRDGQILVREWLDYASNAVPRNQLRLMQEAKLKGRSISVVDGEQKIPDVVKRRLQQPRVFYRREPDRNPFVVGPGRAGT
jgi:WD40 repeat protein/uncharacterized caspase-like protein